MTDITTMLSSSVDAMIADLTEFIEHETPSDNRELLSKGFLWLQQYLHERLGAPTANQVIEDQVHGPVGVNVYDAERGGLGHVMVLCHYDTVWPEGTLRHWPVMVEGDRLTGPGCFDMKAGLVQFVWAVRAAREAGDPLPKISLVLTGDEETGSYASRRTIKQVALEADVALVFEASADSSVKTARKGVGMYTIEVHGVEAHAGLDPERGVSAIDELARVIRTLHEAADLTRGTSVNVGVIRGGSRGNVTAGHALAEVDVRVSSDSEARRIEQLLGSLVPHHPDARIVIAGEWNRPPMERTRGVAELYEIARNEARELGFELGEVSVGGVSDGNYAAAMGVPVLDGLGAVGDGAHARDEWVSLSGIVERAALAARVLSRLAV